MKIKPCPKCGSENIKDPRTYENISSFPYCDTCNFGYGGKDYEDLIKMLWNMLSDYSLDTIHQKYNCLRDNYNYLSARLSKLEDSKPVGLAWFNDVYGDLYDKLVNLEDLKRDKPSPVKKQLKPVNEACVLKEVMAYDSINGVYNRWLLLGYYKYDEWPYRLARRIKSEQGLGWGYDSLKAEEGKIFRCPDITYGDE